MERVNRWLSGSNACFTFLFCILLVLPEISLALTPNEILVVANQNFQESSKLAGYYMEKRKIPAENLLLISTVNDERSTREEYDRKIALPVRTHLERFDPQGLRIRCLVVMYGVPLIVSESELSPDEKKELTKLQSISRELQFLLKEGTNKGDDYLGDLKTRLEENQKKISSLSRADEMASVDSELALARHTGYPLSGWIPNPYFLGYQGKKIETMPKTALLVARLDGPSPQIVRRLVDDSLFAENEGLKGKAYFDARWPDPGKGDLSGYAFYDASLHKAAARVKASGLMQVVLDDKEQLFQPGDGDNAALYCGWYSLANYVDAFRWVTGSVGFHIASQECETLRNPGSKVWCKMMLEKGVAATVGPVGEPYVQAFPVPEVFFALLVEGKATLAECYALSSPFVSWRMVLIGDPLYKPFGKPNQR